MLGICKSFPGIKANDNITLQVEKGEIHALLGENGAGKSTLMNILFGLVKPDSGRIRIRGKDVVIRNPKDAFELGIGMVHQHFQLMENFTVAENIIMGNEGGFVYNLEEACGRIRKISEKYGLMIEPEMKISDITVGMQQRVEIIRMLYRDADILLFDEPTAVLTPSEINEFMKIVRALAAEGKSVIIITHKLEEIKQLARRCTVIRRGKYIDTVDVASVGVQEMASLMVGHPVSLRVEKKPSVPGSKVLEIRNISVVDGKGVKVVDNLSLDVRRGEILGIAGVSGNGQTELAEAVAGLVKISGGSIILSGQDISSLSVRKRNEGGLGHIPEDRLKRGLVPDFSLSFNAAVKNYYTEKFSCNNILRFDEMKQHAEKIIEAYDVRCGEGADSIAGSLSGGNQQKMIIGREIMESPELLLAVQPTRGLDVGAVEFIHRMIVEQRDNGKGVLLISFELDEIFNLSDRIAVINSGHIIDIVKTEETDINEVGLMMAGIKNG